MAKLTAVSIANARPGPQRREIPDAGCRGLYLIVQPSGRKSWAARYRFRQEPVKLTLGSWPALSLQAARAAATDALHEVAQGRDPAARKSEARASAAARELDTVDRLAALYIEQYAKRHTRENSWRQTETVFRNIILPAWSGRPVHNIARRDVIELLESVAADRPIMANRAKAALSRFFRWLADRDVIAASPCIGVAQPSQERPRERVLTDVELRRLWLACDAIGGSAGACIKLLILTGQRRGEIGGLRWSEVDGDVLALPAERMKGKHAHIVPLPAQAAAIVAAMPRIGAYVFGCSPICHFDRIKRALDVHMGETPPWVTHDIRRTAASDMAKLGVPVSVIEKILAHRSGTFRGVVGVYQKHSFLPEMAAALQKWADHVERLVGGKPARTVVSLRSRS